MNSAIEKIVGSDYMRILSHIIGNLDSIEESTWMEQNKQITMLLNEIPVSYRERLTKIPPFNQPMVARKKNKPNKLTYNTDCRHEVVVRSDFFKRIRDDVASLNKLMETAYDGKEFFSHAKWEGMTPNEDTITYHKKISEIVDIILLPSYDLRKKILSKQGIIQDIFKNKTLPADIGLAEVVDIIYNFAIVEYRSKLLNDNRGYMKLFMKTFQDSNLAKMKGSSFTSFIDSIDFDKIENKDKLKSFAEGARKIFERAQDGKQIDAALLDDIRKLLENPVPDSTDVDGVEF